MTDKHEEAALGSRSSDNIALQHPGSGGVYPPYQAPARVNGTGAYGTTATGVPTQIQLGHGPVVPAPQPCLTTSTPLPRKSYVVAYILWAILGIFGAHHFYLRRNFFGILYLCTFGLLGCGWIIDFFRLPCLISETNHQQEEFFIRYGATMTTAQLNNLYLSHRDRSLSDAYVLWFPLGLFGLHQFYLGRLGFGVTYSCTLGLGGVGWLVDFFRIPSLVQETNDKLRKIRNGEVVERTLECSVADAYQLAFPLGFLGLHHFYMGRVSQGLVYLFTLGLLGVGWLADLVRMPCLVARHNKEVQEDHTWLRHLDDAYIFAIPFGIFGFHRFYLKSPRMGILYLCTAGLFVIGWLIDLIRMPWLVKAANEKEADRQRIIGNNRVYVFQPATTPICPGQTPSQYGTVPQPLYPAQQRDVSYVSYHNPSNHCDQSFPVPPSVNAQPNTQVPQPLNPPPYGVNNGLQPSELPPTYQESIDPSNQANIPSGPADLEQKTPL